MFKRVTDFIKQLGYDLFYENGSLSLAKLTACWGYVVYTWTSIYLMVTEQTWGHYTEFSTYMAGTSTLILTGNKFINSKYNSVQGGFGTSDGTIDGGRPENNSCIPPAVETKLEELNDNIQKASEMYDEYKEKAERISHTVDSAKETIGKVSDGIESFTGFSIRDGINLASMAKKNLKKK